MRAFTPMYPRAIPPLGSSIFRSYSTRPGLTPATSFLYAPLTMTHLSNAAGAHLPERRRTLARVRARACSPFIIPPKRRDAGVTTRHRAIRKDGPRINRIVSVERQLNLARRRRHDDDLIYAAFITPFAVIRNRGRNGSALLRRQCDESINTYELMMR